MLPLCFKQMNGQEFSGFLREDLFHAIFSEKVDDTETYLTNNQKMSQLNKALVCIHTAKY